MAAGGSAQETRVLVSIWGEADVQSQLDGVVRNKVVYEKIIYWLTSYIVIAATQLSGSRYLASL